MAQKKPKKKRKPIRSIHDIDRAEDTVAWGADFKTIWVWPCGRKERKLQIPGWLQQLGRQAHRQGEQGVQDKVKKALGLK